MSGPSHIYMRLLRGKVTPARYVAVVKRAVRRSSVSPDPDLVIIQKLERIQELLERRERDENRRYDEHIRQRIAEDRHRNYGEGL